MVWKYIIRQASKPDSEVKIDTQLLEDALEMFQKVSEYANRVNEAG